MVYLVHILVGLLIVLGVDLGITAFWAYLDARSDENLGFKEAFAKNNHIPTKLSDIFE